MTISVRHDVAPEPVNVRVTDDILSVDLVDGRTISVPLQWYPRLFHGSPAERAKFELMADGIHWEDLNEDVSVEALLRGERSGETPQSLQRWLERRVRGEKEVIPELPLPPELEKQLRDMGINW